VKDNKLTELFQTHSDCYADTWTQDGLGAPMVEGDVIQAMTFEAFKKAIADSAKSCPLCNEPYDSEEHELACYLIG